MHIAEHPDLPAFLAVTSAFLLRAPTHNQFLLMAQGVPKTLLSAVDGEIVGALRHVPPWPAQLSPMPAEAAVALAHAVGDDIETAFGGDNVVRAFAEALARRRGGTVESEASMGLFEARTVADLPVPEGAARPTTEVDAALLQAWLCAFHAEAVPYDPVPSPDAGLRMATSGRFWLWTVGEKPHAFAAYGRDIGGWLSVGPVYTPSDSRGKGYATALVAHITRLAIAEGRPGCTLFTDLTNPTSNAIYERIGYRRVGSMSRLRVRRAV